MRELVRFAIVPLILLGFSLATILVYQALHLPTRDAVLDAIQGLYAQYGPIVVLLGALMEGTLFLNLYLPGSTVIALGVIFANGDIVRAILVVVLATFGLFGTALINYALGRYGWYRLFVKLGIGDELEAMKKRFERRGLALILSTYFHPNVGALAATSAGILRASFWPFAGYSLLALTFWDTFWGIVFYLIGPFLLRVLSQWVITGILALWFIYAVVKFFRSRGRDQAPSIP